MCEGRKVRFVSGDATATCVSRTQRQEEEINAHVDPGHGNYDLHHQGSTEPRKNSIKYFTCYVSTTNPYNSSSCVGCRRSVHYHSTF